MILYKSTRGQDLKSYTFSEALLKGIAEDGGLLVPETFPHISIAQLQQLLKKSYPEIAEFLFNQFETDLSKKIVHDIVMAAYASNFDVQNIAPVHPLLDQQFILELWHGPTSAFKDMALQICLYFSKKP